MDPGAVVLRHGPDQTGSKGLVGPSHFWSPTGDSRAGPQGPAGNLPTRQMEAERGLRSSLNGYPPSFLHCAHFSLLRCPRQ